MKPSSSSPSSSLPPCSASSSSSASFYERYETMFNCGGCIVEDDEPVAAATYQQSSCEADGDSNRTTEAISHWSSYKKERKQQESPPVVTVTYTEARYDEIDKFDMEKPTRQQSKEKANQAEVAAHEYFNRITNNRNQPNIQMAIPISPSAMLTPQQRRQQQQEEHVTPIISNKTVATPSSPPTSPKRYDMFKVVMPSYRLKDRLKKERLKKERRRHDNGGDRVKHVDSDCTQDTQSMSESDGDDDLSVDESLYGSEEQPPEEQDTLVSILRRKVKLGTLLESKNITDDKNNRVRVRFEKDTKFPDPNEIPSPTRKHVPRMSQRQRQEYQLNHYQPTIQKQLDLSSLLMAAAGPSLVISTYNNDEFRDYSTTNLSQQDNACRYQKRLARRAQQKQYQYSSGSSSQYRHTSSSAAEELLSHYYNQSEDVASFYAFR
mmetsp:Transcript_29255/g.33534  ORF Transcript_29255/g.33534 Transcript_29255/m.33534 type:complete len:435 (-) Transcript_29255:36-1340(-)